MTECSTEEGAREHNKKRILMDNLAVWHAALSSSTNIKLSPEIDLPGDQSLIKYLEEVLWQFESGNPPAYLDEK